MAVQPIRRPLARKPITVFALEPEPVQAEGLRVILAGHSEFEFAGAAADVLEALRRVAAERPEIALIDIDDPPADPRDLIGAVRRACPDTRPVIWARELDEVDAERYLDAGARGAVRKTRPPEVLVDCLRAVSHGRTWVDEPTPPLPQSGRRGTYLTPRERDVLALIVKGKTNPEIARALGITVATVKVHVASILDKTGTRDRVELAARANPLGREYPA